MEKLPTTTDVVIIGAGFAGAATAWALAQAGVGAGVILEQEDTYGVHASGRNAALLRLVEEDPIVRALALRSFKHLEAFDREGSPVLGRTGGLTLADDRSTLEKLRDDLRESGPSVTVVEADEARARFPFLQAIRFTAALWCPAEAVVDIHELLTRYVRLAREGGFRLFTRTRVEDLIVEAGRVRGVVTDRGEVRADIVVDACGAWAGRLGRGPQPLPLRPLRRHLFVSGPSEFARGPMPYAWVEEAAFYLRAEGDGFLLSPCDETEVPPGLPSTDPAAAELLAEKLERTAPRLSTLAIRRAWACLRTFAPDRRPAIGADIDLPGLYHVSGLGGFGMTTSAAVGELAAAIIRGRPVDWIDPDAVAPSRLFPTGR